MKLVLKAGQIKIPHFAHFKNSQCELLFSEGESATHLLGKQQLYQLFTKLHLEPILEPYLPQIRQRPDILISKDGRQFAIEFQCSKIPFSLFQQRTNGYVAANITPIWIVHTPNDTFKMRGLTKISINHTNAQYMQTYKKQRFLITYDVRSEMFYYVSNLIHVHRLQYFGVVQALPLFSQQFPFLIPQRMTKPIFQQVYLRFIKYRDAYIHHRLLLSKKGVNDRFFRAVYELELTSSRLPNFIGISVRNTHLFEVFCVEWQVQLFYFMKCHQLTPQSMNIKAIPYFLQWANLEQTEQARDAIEHYLAILKQLNVKNVHENVSQKKIYEILYNELVAIG